MTNNVTLSGSTGICYPENVNDPISRVIRRRTDLYNNDETYTQRTETGFRRIYFIYIKNTCPIATLTKR